MSVFCVPLGWHLWNFPWMSVDGQGTKWHRKIAVNFNRRSRVHERYRQQTDWTAIAYSERERWGVRPVGKSIRKTINKNLCYNFTHSEEAPWTNLRQILYSSSCRWRSQVFYFFDDYGSEFTTVHGQSVAVNTGLALPHSLRYCNIMLSSLFVATDKTGVSKHSHI